MTKWKHLLLSAILLAGALYASERKIVRYEDPVYPIIAVRMGLHGTLKLKIWINPEGAVRRLEYIGGHPG
jgi:outer membrane biosynthesis protein TonB